VSNTNGAPKRGEVPAGYRTSKQIRCDKDIIRFRRRIPLGVLLLIALTLAGLGHYYLLYMHDYPWDALIFCAASAGMFVLAWRRSGPTRGRRWALFLATLRRLASALRYPGRSSRYRLLLASAAGLNVLAALVATTIRPPIGMAIVATLWVGSLLVFAYGLDWPVRSRVGIVPASAVDQDILLDQSPTRDRFAPYALATVAWLTLAMGMALIGRRHPPRQVESLLQPLLIWLEPVRLDSPNPPAAALGGGLVLLIGGALMTALAAQLGGLAGMVGLFSHASRPMNNIPCHARWKWMLLASGFIWLGIVGLAMSRVESPGWAFVGAWALGLAIQIWGWAQMDRAAGVRLRATRPGYETVLLMAALGLAMAISLYQLEDIPNSIWGDDGAFWEKARAIASGAYRPNPFSFGVYSFPMMATIFQSLCMWVFEPTLWSWRLSSAIPAVLTMIPLFYLTRSLFGSRIAWSAVGLFIVMPFCLAFARMGNICTQSVFPVTFTLWLFIEALRHRSRLLAFLAGCAGGLGFLTFTAGRVGVILVALLSIYLLIHLRPFRRVLLTLIVGYIVGWTFTAAPTTAYGLLHYSEGLLFKVVEAFAGNAFYGRHLFPEAVLSYLYPIWNIYGQELFFEPHVYVILLARGVLRTAFGLVSGGYVTQHYIMGALAGPGAIFLVAGLGWALANLRRVSGAMSLLWVFTCALLLSVACSFPPRDAHLVPIIPALAVLTAVGIWLLAEAPRRAVGRWLADLLGIGITLTVMVLSLRTFFVAMPQQYKPNLENVMLWTARETARQSSVVFVLNAPYPPDWRNWWMEQFGMGDRFRTVLVEDVSHVDIHALCQPECSVFFLPADHDRLLPLLVQTLGRGELHSYEDRGGKAIGYSYRPITGK
jgi:4-amino-4-deoxy-L-arabinose transferase-like glycosyltransferase